MRAELSFLQKVLRLILICIVAAALTVTAFGFFPTSGVRSDVIVLFSKQPDGLYARDVTSNALLIAKSTLRERKVEGAQLQISYENQASMGRGGNTFSINTYGQDEARNLARENRTALNEILLDIRKHYGTTFPLFFDVVGNTYQVLRWPYIVTIGLVSFLLSACIVSRLFLLFIGKSHEDEVKNAPEDDVVDEVRSDAPNDFQEWYKDKHVLEQISAYEEKPTDQSESQELMPSQARQSFEQKKNHLRQEVLVPQTQTKSDEKNTQGQQEQATSQQVDLPQEREEDQRQTKKKLGSERSRLAEKWGKGSAAERLRALESSQEELAANKKEPEKIQETFSLSSLPRGRKSENARFEQEVGVPKQNIQLQHSGSQTKKAFHLPHQRLQQDAVAQELDDTIIERVQDHSHAGKPTQGDSDNAILESDEVVENFFAPGGSLSQNPSSSTQSAATMAPGNLPIVDVSDFSAQPDTQTLQQVASAEQTSTNVERQQQEQQQEQEEERIDFSSEDAQILVDSSEQSYSTELQDDVKSKQIAYGEPTNEDLKNRLNKLLRGEL